MTGAVKLCRGLALALVIAGCAPQLGYVPLSDHGRFGYASQELGPDRLRVSFVAPRRTVSGNYYPAESAAADASVRRAFDLALLRAAELTLARGQRELTVVQRENDVDAQIQRYRDPTPLPGLPIRGYRSAGRRAIDDQPVATVRTTVVIEVTTHSGAAGDRGAVVAQDIVTELRALYEL